MNYPAGGRRRPGWASFATLIGVVAAIAGIVSAVYTVLDHHGNRPKTSDSSAGRAGIPIGSVEGSGRPSTDPAAFRGKWTGTITQFDNPQQYPVTIEITGGQSGSIVGSSVYPRPRTTSCSASTTREPARSPPR